jgi:hypothetical protein
MTPERKIFLDRTDTLEIAVDLIAKAKAERVVLNIPRQSVLGESVHNFQILKREGDTAGKELAVESIDEHILELAALAKIPAKNPVFRIRERTVADIIPKFKSAEIEEASKWEPPVTEPKPKRSFFKRQPKSATRIDETVTPEEEVTNLAKPKRRRLKIVPALVVFLVVLGIGYLLAVYLLPRVTINLFIKKTASAINEKVVVNAAATSVVDDGKTMTLPGQLLIASSSLVMSFPATGSSTVSSRASGTLIVYNAYSSAPQILVANTRFVSPDGHLFRSTEKVTVPGAKVTGGAVVPASVPVTVVAAEPGPDYNVPSGGHWTIPGFAGTPRYAKFYADAPHGMTGGASGVMPTATPNDILAARAKAEANLQDALQSQFAILWADKFKILPDAFAFTTSSEIVTPVTSSSQFSIIIAGAMREMVFNEGMLKDTLLAAAGASSSTSKIDEFTINYSSTTLNLDKGLMTFNVSGNLVYEPAVDLADLQKAIAGRDAASLKTLIFNIPGLEKANISFWPFYVTSVPKDLSKIQLNLH